eukprot:CAMPEP_0178820102 /NCGR_PEP_ID=MMETSP0746-20121128/3330_1 /TAXON_ID=913974 /ORGANISM="Nitzschia punctata, Strain CCMP561" /LENGTH=420 /DNA_ID=CAMNT_0020481419 /DNA_START=411 /DNA_END=1674 /DNA_ORIENTATION=+
MSEHGEVPGPPAEVRFAADDDADNEPPAAFAVAVDQDDEAPAGFPVAEDDEPLADADEGLDEVAPLPPPLARETSGLTTVSGLSSLFAGAVTGAGRMAVQAVRTVGGAVVGTSRHILVASAVLTYNVDSPYFSHVESSELTKRRAALDEGKRKLIKLKMAMLKQEEIVQTAERQKAELDAKKKRFSIELAIASDIHHDRLDLYSAATSEEVCKALGLTTDADWDKLGKEALMGLARELNRCKWTASTSCNRQLQGRQIFQSRRCVDGIKGFDEAVFSYRNYLKAVVNYPLDGVEKDIPAPTRDAAPASVSVVHAEHIHDADIGPPICPSDLQLAQLALDDKTYLEMVFNSTNPALKRAFIELKKKRDHTQVSTMAEDNKESTVRPSKRRRIEETVIGGDDMNEDSKEESTTNGNGPSENG